MSCVPGNGWRGMAAVLLPVLVVAACVCAEQYGGGVMPQYGAVDYEPEYRARSPDAPAPLDYKYQEEPHESEKLAKFPEEEDRRRKVGRVQGRPALEDTEEELEQIEDKALDSEARSGRRRRNRRGRGRREEGRREQLSSRRRPPLPQHARDDPYLNSIDYRDDRKYVETNERTHRETTAKVLGRKPRQRMLVPPPLDFLSESTSAKMTEDFDDDDKLDRPDKHFDYLSGEESDRSRQEGREGRVRATLPGVERERGAGDESEDSVQDWELPRRSKANYAEYNDYQAMRNVGNIQNKIPTLLRRPTTTTAAQRTPNLFGNVRPWPGRRAGQLGVPARLPAPPAAVSSETAAAESTSDTPVQLAPESEAPMRLDPVSPSVHVVPISTFNPTSNDTITPPANGSELSIADKSRLSILKKAQMKEAAGRTTKKPPVLLHVTSHVPTVVMVAPATGDPWLRAREVAGDSPATLEKVKRLMRQKLISSAKSIRDLTDNWDETVCDYIDVGMLASIPDSSAVRTLAPLALLSSSCTFLLLIDLQ